MRTLSLAALVLAACSTSEKTPDNRANQATQAGQPASSAPSRPGDLPAPPDVAAPPADAERTASGLASKQLQPGTSDEKPTAEDSVVVNYTGWTTDGHMFDSSVVRGQPARFPLANVIPGWTEGLQLMKVGEKRRFWIPPNLAYGEKPARPGAPAGMLVFDVELMKVIPAPKPIPAPPDVAAAPNDAKRTPTGLAYKVLQKGTGTRKPKATDVVEVNYTGWTTAGKMFDSSIVRGQTATFPLQNVIPGWTEGLQLMNEGEKCRFWIPGKLAYGDKPMRPGAPAGTLVFDVELIKIR
jgi:peptidylprolyl isomerase